MHCSRLLPWMVPRSQQNETCVIVLLVVVCCLQWCLVVHNDVLLLSVFPSCEDKTFSLHVYPHSICSWVHQSGAGLPQTVPILEKLLWTIWDIPGMPTLPRSSTLAVQCCHLCAPQTGVPRQSSMVTLTVSLSAQRSIADRLQSSQPSSKLYCEHCKNRKFGLIFYHSLFHPVGI